MANINKYLKQKGYKYAVMLNSNLTEVWTTKANKLKSGDFSKNSRWDCYKLTGKDTFKNPVGEIIKL